jgi:hypothetical protein
MGDPTLPPLCADAGDKSCINVLMQGSRTYFIMQWNWDRDGSVRRALLHNHVTSALPYLLEPMLSK